MKKIYSDTYKKVSQRYDLPGDPGLPPGVSNRDIDDSAGGDPRREGSKVVEWLAHNEMGSEIPVIVAFDFVEWGENEVEINITEIKDKNTNESMLYNLPEKSILDIERGLAENIDNI